MRHFFEIPPDVTYLNCAYMGPQMKTVTEAGQSALRRKVAPWELASNLLFDEVEELRNLAASLFVVDPEGMAFVPSVSYGMQIAANNLSLKAGDEIVVLAEQFPSNVYPWRALAQKTGAVVRTVPRHESGNWTKNLLSAMNSNTAVVATPHCHWTDGSAVDLVTVGERCRDLGAVLAVDASQSLGAWELDVAAVQPDFMVSVGYKWLLGPMGLSYLYVAPKHRSGQPLEHNWLNRAGSENFARLVDYREDFQLGARRFDAGHRSNLMSVSMALAALKQIKAWGIRFISSEIAKITSLIAMEAGKLGFRTTEPAFRSPHLIGLQFSSEKPEEVLEKLRRHRVYASVRGNSIRVSPHLYNTEADVARLIDALRAPK